MRICLNGSRHFGCSVWNKGTMRTAAKFEITFGFIILVTGIIVFLCFLPAMFPNKKKTTPIDVANMYFSQRYNTTSSITVGGNTFRIVVPTSSQSIVQFIWTDLQNFPRVVWDSQNANCGPNYNNYLTMVANVPNLNTQSVTLASTPLLIINNVPVTFRLQLYNGELRIENTTVTPNRFWSLFNNPGPNKLTNWPLANVNNGYTTILWAQTNTIQNPLFMFTTNGALILRNPTTEGPTNVLWSANASQPIPPTCPAPPP